VLSCGGCRCLIPSSDPTQEVKNISPLAPVEVVLTPECALAPPHHIAGDNGLPGQVSAPLQNPAVEGRVLRSHAQSAQAAGRVAQGGAEAYLVAVTDQAEAQ
jgi:hypothetical protein